jgi:hypothetical protein
MPGSLSGPRAKIRRAKKHIHEFEAARGDLVFANSTHPDVILIDDYPEPDKQLYRVGLVPCVDDGVAAIAGDAIHNLRSSLDLLFTELVRERHNTPNPSEYFPTSGTREGYETRCDTQVKGRISDDAFKLVCAAEAYPGGNGEALWRVHRLDVEDKHLILYALSFNLSSLSPGIPKAENFPDWVNQAMGEGMGQIFLRPANNLFPLKEGDELFIGPTEPLKDPKFRFDVAFTQPEIVKGEPVLPTLVQMREAVESTVDSFGAVL